jgi:hypothetical protein
MRRHGALECPRQPLDTPALKGLISLDDGTLSVPDWERLKRAGDLIRLTFICDGVELAGVHLRAQRVAHPRLENTPCSWVCSERLAGPADAAEMVSFTSC